MRPNRFANADAPSETDESRDGFLADCIAGLAARPKTLPCKYFYDARGSTLFEQITALPEYYPTRTETALLRKIAPEIAQTIEPDTALIEFGSGASIKTRILLDAAPTITRYVPVDICIEELEQSAASLRESYPSLVVNPVHADFTGLAALDPAASAHPRLGFFPGSTIGNFDTQAAVQFLASARKMLGQGSRLLLGIDLRKDEKILLAAYDDAQGVTAAFNLNVLTRLERELGARIDPSSFEHLAVWNDAQSRIEMHLVSTRPQTVTIDGHSFEFAAGETIHTENCHKFTLEHVHEMASEAGWQVTDEWVSDAPEFALVMLAA